MSAENLAHARERIGQVLRERWLLEEVLGLGGMAAVYRARHRNGARAAIKLLHPPLSADHVIRERFLREAYLANSIEHSGVVRILDDDADPKLGPFIVMELLEGESVLDLLERGGTITPEHALDIGDQTLDVLSLAHERGIIHRDLKPANLFLCEGGVVKVLDFGIARLLDATQARLTRTGVPLGTPAYMAPEQARGLGRHIDGRADLYALGATLFRILTGRHVHVGQGAEQIALVATQRAPSLASVAPRLPPALCAVIDRALLFEPERRYANAAEMQVDLRRALAATNPSSARLRATRGSAPPSSLPKLPGSKPDDVVQLADALRAEAHKQAKRPDAFSAPKSVPPSSAAPSSAASSSGRSIPRAPIPTPMSTTDDDDEDENMPTVAYQPKNAAPPLVARRPISQPSMPAQQASSPGRNANTRPLAKAPIDFGHVTPPPMSRPVERSSAAHEAFARIPNVPVPSLPPSLGADSARQKQSPQAAPAVAPLVPGRDVATMTHGGAVVLPAAVPSHFENTQYQIEQAREGRVDSLPPVPQTSGTLPPARRFAQTLAEPEQFVPPSVDRPVSGSFSAPNARPVSGSFSAPSANHHIAPPANVRPSHQMEIISPMVVQDVAVPAGSPRYAAPQEVPVPTAPIAPLPPETNYLPLIIVFAVVMLMIIAVVIWAVTR